MTSCYKLTSTATTGTTITVGGTYTVGKIRSNYEYDTVSSSLLKHQDYGRKYVNLEKTPIQSTLTTLKATNVLLFVIDNVLLFVIDTFSLNKYYSQYKRDRFFFLMTKSKIFPIQEIFLGQYQQI